MCVPFLAQSMPSSCISYLSFSHECGWNAHGFCADKGRGTDIMTAKKTTFLYFCFIGRITRPNMGTMPSDRYHDMLLQSMFSLGGWDVVGALGCTYMAELFLCLKVLNHEIEEHSGSESVRD